MADSLGLDIEVTSRKIYTEDLGLTEEELSRFSRELIHPAVHSLNEGTTSETQEDEKYRYIIEVGYKPGVMDPEGRSSKILAETVLGKEFPFERRVAVQHQRLIVSDQSLNETQLRKIAKLFSNDTVQSYRILSYEEFERGIGPYMPTVKVPEPEPVQHYNLNVSDTELMKISQDRFLALDIDEMKAIQKHHKRKDIISFLKKRNIIKNRKRVGLTEDVTDVELELYGQSWSEHCKHKIFNAMVEYHEGSRVETIDGIFTKFIKEPTLAIQKQKPHFIKSVLKDNSGVVDLDESLDYYFCFKNETHNSPSFMEPYGGAITGIVGVYRDPLGTGRGSMLTFGLWGYCTGSIFYDGNLRPPLHPDQLIDGIHRGVRDGGNKHGVPTAIGGTFFDNSYLGKCIVYVGAGGLIPKDVGDRPGYEKWINSGDRCVVVGGRVGKDGIHGATASSKEYSEGTPAGHVQIGDPYTQKNVQEFMLDALREGLINFAQDSGAGGIGSAAGEMAQESNGAKIELDKDLFKYEGLAPWEILESESQERMFLAVTPEKMNRLVELAEKWDVEWRDIGEFNDSGYFHVCYKGSTVAYTDLDFLHNGTPQKSLKAVWKTPEERGLSEPTYLFDTFDHSGKLREILRRENIASKEFLQREYDTRVQGRTVIPPFIGVNSDVPSDAFVQKIEFDKLVGVACGIGLNPTYSKIDTYNMSMLAANEGLMRVVAVGADPDLTANNGNYCWPGVLPDESDESEYKMAQLVRAAKAQRDFATSTGVATISGKDSMKIQGNIMDAEGKRQRVYGLPALQYATIGKVPDIKKCVTSDFKAAGDNIYAVGLPTRDELGGSEFYESMGEVGLNVPKVYLEESMNIYRRLHKAINDELVESAKACSKGGLAVALSTAAFGGGLGASVDLSSVPTNMAYDAGANVDMKLLYSESASRFVISVAPENAERFEHALGGYANQIGYVGKDYLEITGLGGKPIIKEETAKLKDAWQSTFRHKMHRG
jgi:phosphoribosylformylglycinamidine synthase